MSTLGLRNDTTRQNHFRKNTEDSARSMGLRLMKKDTYGIEIRANCRAVGPNAYSCPITQPFGLGYANVWAVGPENRRANSLLYRAEGPKIRIRPGLATALMTTGPVSGSSRPEPRRHASARTSRGQAGRRADDCAFAQGQIPMGWEQDDIDRA